MLSVSVLLPSCMDQWLINMGNHFIWSLLRSPSSKLVQTHAAWWKMLFFFPAQCDDHLCVYGLSPWCLIKKKKNHISLSVKDESHTNTDVRNLCRFSSSCSTQAHFFVLYVCHACCALIVKAKTTHFSTNRKAAVSAAVPRAAGELTEPFNEPKERHQNR